MHQKNIRKLLIHKLRKEERPPYLQRQTQTKVTVVLVKAKTTLKEVRVSLIPKIDKKTSKE